MVIHYDDFCESNQNDPLGHVRMMIGLCFFSENGQPQFRLVNWKFVIVRQELDGPDSAPGQSGVCQPDGRFASRTLRLDFLCLADVV